MLWSTNATHKTWEKVTLVYADNFIPDKNRENE